MSGHVVSHRPSKLLGHPPATMLSSWDSVVPRSNLIQDGICRAKKGATSVNGCQNLRYKSCDETTDFMRGSQLANCTGISRRPQRNAQTIAAQIQGCPLPSSSPQTHGRASSSRASFRHGPGITSEKNHWDCLVLLLLYCDLIITIATSHQPGYSFDLGFNSSRQSFK